MLRDKNIRRKEEKSNLLERTLPERNDLEEHAVVKRPMNSSDVNRACHGQEKEKSTTKTTGESPIYKLPSKRGKNTADKATFRHQHTAFWRHGSIQKGTPPFFVSRDCTMP